MNAAAARSAFRRLLVAFALTLLPRVTQAQQSKVPPAKPAPIVSPSAVPTAPPQADLQIVSFEFAGFDKCPGPASGAFPKFNVRVRNGGTAASRAGIVIRVADDHYPAWAHSQGLPALGIGQEVQQVVMLSPATDRAHADAAAPHPFVAVVDPGHTVVDPNPGNNRSNTLSVGRPCAAPRGTPLSGGAPGTAIPQAAPISGGAPGTVMPQAAPISGGQPGTVPAPRAAPISGGSPSVVPPRGTPISAGPPGVVPPKPAPVAGGEAATVKPGPAVDLELDVTAYEYANHNNGVCTGGFNRSPVFTFEVRNYSDVGTGAPVLIRAVEQEYTEFRADTTLPPLGPRERAVVYGWVVPMPRGLRFVDATGRAPNLVRHFVVTVDPDERLNDPDRRNNSLSIRPLLIVCYTR